MHSSKSIILSKTYRNRQGNDAGTQYASAIFVADDKQKQIAEKVKNDLQGYLNNNKSRYSGKEIVTKIYDATKFVSFISRLIFIAMFFYCSMI